MTIKKLINYKLFDVNGQNLNLLEELKVRISDTSGNYLIHKDIIRHKQSKRQFTVSTKTRSEVKGGGRKPWKQKGIGKARVGSNRSPLWKGGGIIFGPKPRKINSKLNKKEKQLALQTILYNKKENSLIIKDLESNFKKAKTKYFLVICRDFKIDINKKLLIIVSKKTRKLKLALRNLKNIELICVSNINTLSIIQAKQIIISNLALNYLKNKIGDNNNN